jgi:8-oxo-dGTP pyrophosphatase MutT (NUDIX family)
MKTNVLLKRVETMKFLSSQSSGEPLTHVPIHRMTRTSSSKHIKGRLAGASLLCFSVDPSFSCVYFLLGKERHNVRWPKGSNRWSDFGGRVSSSDGCAEDTAAREFFEETLAVVKYFEDDELPRQSWHDIADNLREGKYTMKLIQGNSSRKFVIFVKQIPWDPEVISRFSTYRSCLTCPRFIVPSGWEERVATHPGLHPGEDPRVIRKEFLEKKMLGLWSVPQLRKAVDHGGTMTYRNGYVEHCRPSFVESLEIILSELAFHEPGVMDD